MAARPEQARKVVARLGTLVHWYDSIKISCTTVVAIGARVATWRQIPRVARCSGEHTKMSTV